MSAWRQKWGLITAVAIAAAAVTAVVFAATSDVRQRATLPNGPSSREREIQLRRAARFRALANKLIVRRDAAHPGRHITAGSAPDPLARAAIRDLAIVNASVNGDSNPRSAELFASTRRPLEKFLHAGGSDTNEPVFVLVVQGNFVAYDHPTPSGRPIAGTIMAVVFDPNSLNVTDWALGAKRVYGSTTLLGAGIPLRL